MKTKHQIICLFLTFYILNINDNLAQIICNSSFELPTPGTFPNDESQVEELNCWLDRKEINSSGNEAFHSPDWYYVDNYYVVEDINGNGQYSPIYGNNNSNGYIGMLKCEMVQQRMLQPLQKNKKYYLEFYIRFISQPFNNVEPLLNKNFPNDLASIMFIFSKTRLEYDNPLISCSDIECQNIKRGVKKRQLVEMNNLSSTQHNYGLWHKKSIIFTSDDDYDWINFQLSHLETEGVCETYLLFDDIHIEEIKCTHCSNCSNVDGDINITCNQINTGSAPLTFYGLSNVKSVELSVFSLGGSLVYSNSYFCHNGWENNELQIQLPFSLAPQPYTAVIKYYNSCNTASPLHCSKNFSFIYEDIFSGTYNNCLCRPNELIKPCCLESYSLLNEQLQCDINQTYTYQTIDHLNVGGGTVVNDDARVEFVASQSVTLSANFTSNRDISQNGFMMVYLNDCGRSTANNNNTHTTTISSSLEEQEQNISTEIVLYPNPANSSVTIENKSNSMQTFEMYNISGKNVLNGKVLEANKFVLNLEHLPKGFYTIMFSNTIGEKQYKKLVIH
jgi:hypothetical protein